MTDSVPSEIIIQAQQGDHDAFGEIYSRHKQLVFALCFRIVRDATEAEDMSQEVFLHLYRFIRTYRGDCKFTTWLHRVCVSVLYCKLRKKRLSTISIDSPFDTDDAGEDKPLELIHTDNVLSGTVDRVCLERAIDLLAAGYRMALVLHDFYGLEHNEIAQVLGCSVGNSKSQVHKARLHVRASLSPGRDRPRRVARFRSDSESSLIPSFSYLASRAA